MLTELRIRNFAVIDAVTLPLAPGFNVLSGETGAGKSIILGALGLLLGERGSADVVRTGSDRAVVEGVFDASGRTEVLTHLDAHGIDVEDGLVVLRREVSAGGKGRAWINGTTVTAGALATTGRMLANLHGQHEAQTLLREDAQRDILDEFGEAADDSRRVREAHAALTALRAGIAELESRRDEAVRRADYLRHVAGEIDGARLIAGEDERLDQEARRLSHVEELRAQLAQLRGALDTGENAVMPQLALARRALAAAQRLDPGTAALAAALEEAFVAIEELARDAQAYESTLESDPARLAALDERRALIHRLTRKYGGTVDAVLETAARARAELDLIDTAGLDLRALQERERDEAGVLAEAAASLSRRRGDAARRLARAVERLLPELGLPGGRFSVSVTSRDATTATGSEDIAFLVALNVGHEARPLSRVASGGELSRVMLALKTILARLDRVPTLVFDEVDVGIGGVVALKVGDALKRLAAQHQVLVITHLPQIAARADHHVVVAKRARKGVTSADIAVVTDDARVTELARMLGGDPGSDLSRAHARELLSAADAAN